MVGPMVVVKVDKLVDQMADDLVEQMVVEKVVLLVDCWVVMLESR